MPHDVDPANWLAYLDAASIKVQLAEYHLLRLSKGQPLSQYSHAVQAEFEGIMYSLVAASDQLGEAINIGLRIRPGGICSLQTAIEHMPRCSLRRQLTRWQETPIAADVRAMRRLAAHHHYEKRPGGATLELQEPPNGRPYGRSRQLLPYAEAAVAHLRNLVPLIDLTRTFLETCQPPLGPSTLAVLERAKSLANEAMFTVVLQCRRLASSEPEDTVFPLRPWADFHYLVIALTHLRRAASLAWTLVPQNVALSDAIARFDESLPDLKTMRDVSEHLDDYALDRPTRHHAEVDRRQLAVGEVAPSVFRWLNKPGGEFRDLSIPGRNVQPSFFSKPSQMQSA